MRAWRITVKVDQPKPHPARFVTVVRICPYPGLDMRIIDALKQAGVEVTIDGEEIGSTDAVKELKERKKR